LYPILVSCYCLTHTVVCDVVVSNCRNWRLLAPWNEAKITVPVKFIAGDKDIGVQSFGVEKYIKSGEFKSTVPDLEVAVIEGHHFLQQEQAERVNSEIISYLVRFTSQEASS
jgi:pimeloyl-ACP methyl ester carboxylesterase